MLDGDEEYVTRKGGLVLDDEGKPVMQRRYSNTLAGMLQRAYRLQVYRDRPTLGVAAGDLMAPIAEGHSRAMAAA